MIFSKGEKIHLMYRSFYKEATRRHFVGEVIEVENALCRLQGYAFVYDDKTTEFYRKQKPRISIIDVAESGVIANIISPDVNLDEIPYRYVSGAGLVATDDKQFSLNINEFGAMS